MEEEGWKGVQATSLSTRWSVEILSTCLWEANGSRTFDCDITDDCRRDSMERFKRGLYFTSLFLGSDDKCQS